MSFKRSYNYHDALVILSWLTFLILPFFSEIHLVYSLASAVLLFEIIRNYRLDKIDLRNAYDYCRVNQPLWKSIIIYGFIFIVVFGYGYVENVLPEREGFDFMYYGAPLLLLYAILESRLSNFNNGMRWYLSGIKLPGRRSLLIPWRFVTEVQLEGRKLRVTANGKVYKMQVPYEDRVLAERFVRFWEQNGK